MTLCLMGGPGLLCVAVSNAVFFLVYRFLPEYGDAKRLALKMIKKA